MKSGIAQTTLVMFTIIGVGVGLGTVMPDQEALREDIFAGQEALRDQIDGLRDQIDGLRDRIDGLREDMREDNAGVRKEVSDLRSDMVEGNEKLRGDMANLDVRVGHLEGLLKGLRGHDQAAQPV